MTDHVSLSDLLDRADQATDASALLRDEARMLIAITRGLLDERRALVLGLDQIAGQTRIVMQYAALAR
ncbi:MAG: hypothetical protein K2X71_06305 [Methylobacterium sp.]|uniref:hypothetical protein n=1 Tax=Methylobacterium sp. TaxID=409 RepID=UPI0025887D4A|nr:hypothetical protein [Methylobacterium sp.]MBY0295637.1 hypothetical protein [Methylobacterium sp.]